MHVQHWSLTPPKELKIQWTTHRSLRSNLDFSGTILEQNQDTNENGGVGPTAFVMPKRITYISYIVFIDIIISPKHCINMYKSFCNRYVYVCGPSLGEKFPNGSINYKVSSPNPRSACLLNQKWQNAFFYPSSTSSVSFACNKIMTGLLHTPNLRGVFFITNISPLPKWVGLQKMMQKCWAPFASWSFRVFNLERRCVCSLGCVASTFWRGGKGSPNWWTVPKLLGKPSKYRNVDTSRCVLLV